MLLVCFAPACEEEDGSVDIHRMGPCTLCYLSNLLRCLVTRQGSVQQECGRTLPQADLQTLLCEVNSTVHQALEVPAVKRTDTKYVRMLPAAQNCNTYINTIRYVPYSRQNARRQKLTLNQSVGTTAHQICRSCFGSLFLWGWTVSSVACGRRNLQMKRTTGFLKILQQQIIATINCFLMQHVHFCFTKFEINSCFYVCICTIGYICSCYYQQRLEVNCNRLCSLLYLDETIKQNYLNKGVSAHHWMTQIKAILHQP